MVGGPGDMMGTPPSARGFTLKVFEKGLNKYTTVFKGNEENGYGFLIYNDGDKKLILKGGKGSDHNETIYAGSKELQDIRKEKYSKQDNMEFLRKTCLSGRAWIVKLQNKDYYFIGIWNTSITQEQYNALLEYLSKFPKQQTYIQMGMVGTGPSSEFKLVNSFTPKITSGVSKLSDKEKEFVKTAHMRTPELPASYAKALKKLQAMTENTQYEAYKNIALKLIGKLEKIKLLGKAKTPTSDIVTQSVVDAVLSGLGKNFPELTAKLNDLHKYAFHYSDLGKLHQKSKIDATSWSDPSLDENAEMAQSDVTKLIDYSEKLQSMFSVDDNLEDWVKAKLNHACDYVATVRDYLKFYRDEKEAGTPIDQIDEKWSNKYKKTINCSNPKGFSQKAHCRARKLRQAGKHTKSKPVREIYKEVTNQLLKEFNSSMAMGALKQINNDAKELESMLQPTTELEDWVKAKLNLAGEYLDDVYHHLDHFGPEGRKLDEVKLAQELKEGWRDWVAAGAIGLGALTGGGLHAAKPIKVSRQLVSRPGITQTVQKTTPTKSTATLDQSFVDYIKSVENAGKKGFDKKRNLWFPHKSFEGGSDTIGYGHKIQPGEDFSKGITDVQAETLLKKDLQKALSQVNKEVGGRPLSKKQMEMFVDFVFNMGTLKKFPKFTQAALKNDLKGMKDQYKRFAGGKELKGRNSAFLQRFLTEYFGFNYYF
jgi:GH24 family phage-related lysozyme (muramidase)